MNQSEFKEITCYLPKAWKKWRLQGSTGFGFASHCLEIWREIFKPVTKRSIQSECVSTVEQPA